MNVIYRLVLWGMVAGMYAESAQAQLVTDTEVDSLFVIASSGEVRFRDQVEPAKEALVALGDKAVPRLIEKLTTKSARERLTIINILSDIGPVAIPDLVRALRRSDGLVVQRVCWALGDIGDTTAAGPLLEVVAHPRWQVREQALRALGKIGASVGEQAVLTGLADSIGQVRKAAAVSAGRLGLNPAITPLIAHLDDPFFGARMAAAETLKKLDTVAVIGGLLEAIDEGMNETRLAHALTVMGELAGDETASDRVRVAGAGAIDQLAQFLTDSRASIRATAARALVALDPDDNCGFIRPWLANETDYFVRLQVTSAVADGN